MPFYQKVPVVIEAQKLTPDSISAIMKWCNGKHYNETSRGISGITISTLEGDMIAVWGDWIIKGVEGEFYPCKPSIFEKTYQAMIKETVNG